MRSDWRKPMPATNKPRQLKVLQGTLRKDRDNPHEPDPSPLPSGFPPTPMVKRRAMAVRKWNELISDECWGTVLTLADVDALEEYCLLYDQMVRIQKDIHKHGHTLADERGKSYRNPHCIILRETREAMHRIRLNFGGLPAARAKVATNPAKRKKSQPFSQFG